MMGSPARNLRWWGYPYSLLRLSTARLDGRRVVTTALNIDLYNATTSVLGV